MRKTPRVMVISPQKTDTHLMQGLFGELGCRMGGVSRPEPENLPQFTTEDRTIEPCDLPSVTEERIPLHRYPNIARLARGTAEVWLEFACMVAGVRVQAGAAIAACRFVESTEQRGSGQVSR